MVLNVWLYGVVCLQLFVYVYHFRQDVKILKAAVTVLFLTTTLNTILTISFVYVSRLLCCRGERTDANGT